MTKGELNTLIRKVQNECGLESPTKITYYWNAEDKLVFKLFFESLAVPDSLKIEEEHIQNLFTVNNIYPYEDDFLISSYNTEHGYVEVIPTDQQFKVINSYKELANARDNSINESIVVLAGRRLNEKVAQAHGYILQEAEEDIPAEGENVDTATEGEENANKAAANSTTMAWMCGQVVFIGKDEKEKIATVFTEWAKLGASAYKDMAQKVLLTDGLDLESSAIVTGISNTNVNDVLHGITNQESEDNAKLCTYDSNVEFVKALVDAADKDNSIVVLAPNTTKPDVLNVFSKEEPVDDTLSNAWQDLQNTSKSNFELCDRITKELATEFTSEQVYGTTADAHSPFTAAYMMAQTGEKVEGEKESSADKSLWEEYANKVPDIKQALEEMKNLTNNQNWALLWVRQQAANLQVATITNDLRDKIKQENKSLAKNSFLKRPTKEDFRNITSAFLSAAIGAESKSGSDVTGTKGSGDMLDDGKLFGSTARVDDKNINLPKGDEEKKEKPKKLFGKESYFEEMLNVYCLLNKDRLNQVVEKIGTEG